MIVVVSFGFIDSDPRSKQVANTLGESFGHVKILQIQALRPGVRQIWNNNSITILMSHSTNKQTIVSTWSSRIFAIKHFERARSKLSIEFPELEALVSSESLNPEEYFLPNCISIAYEALEAYLRSLISVGKSVSIVVAEDIVSVLAALLLREQFGLHVVYDAHEIVAEAIRLGKFDVKSKFLEAIRATEKRIWKLVSILVTVSPEIANIMSKSACNRTVLTLPNFSSLNKSTLRPHRVPTQPRRFSYFGGAGEHRNVDLMVKNWPQYDGAPSLSLYIPPSSHASRAKSIARTNRNVFIFKPVEPSMMIVEMSKHDFGLIPYAYPYPYNHASPNKLGEYVAAGIPILANSQPYTAMLINDYGLGLTCNLTSQTEIIAAIDAIEKLDYKTLQENVVRAFHSDLNWERVVTPFVDALSELTHRAHEQSPRTALERSVSNSPRLIRLLDFWLDTTRPLLIAIHRLRFGRTLTRLIPVGFFRRLI